MKEFVRNTELECIRKDWQGNLKIDGEYCNSDTKDAPLMPWQVLKWKLSEKPQSNEKKRDQFRLKVMQNTGFLTAKNDMIVWLGHASFFIRIQGKTLLTDPVFGNISFLKRLAGTACKTADFTGVDYILLSHGHRDHFDKKTLNILLKNNPETEVLLPLELHTYFDKKGIKYQQAGWYQKYRTTAGLEIFFMPAKHWNRRNIRDYNRSLWGSFILRFNGKTIFFAGDTAYGEHFKEIHRLFGAVDYCLLPIGAYKPAFIMQEAHMNPTEALQAFKDLKGKKMIPMHFATYDLSDEPIGEPARILKKEQENNKIHFLDIGAILTIDSEISDNNL